MLTLTRDQKKDEWARTEVENLVRDLLEHGKDRKNTVKARFILAGISPEKFERMWCRELDRRTRQSRIENLIKILSSLTTQIQKGGNRNERQSI